jgi:ubiquinol-cytochrome c reductase cytochrome b subunit
MLMNVLKQVWSWFDERSGLTEMLKPAFDHPVPPNATWMYVFGTATLFSFVLQAVTGIILALSYVPSTTGAYESLQYITNDAFLGGVLRGIHYFGASSMVLFVGIHLIRVFLTGAFKFPRELNWLTGSILLLLTIGNAFTGQLLRWDQNAIWTALVGGMQASRVPFIGVYLARFFISGDVVSGATLTRFFVLHVFILPGSIIGIVGLHLYLVLRHGISEPPKAGRPVDPATYRQWYQDLLDRVGEPFWPNSAWRDVLFSTAMILVIVLLGAFVGAPALTQPPNPSIVQALPRPDWYLLWYFAVLALLPPGLEPWIIVGAPLLLIVWLVLVPFASRKGERHPMRRPLSTLFVITVVVAIGVMWNEGAKAPWSPAFDAQPLPESVIGVSSGPVHQGGQLFYQKGCEYCHTVNGYGGTRGPNLSTIGNQRDAAQLTVRILHGGINMPAFGGILDPTEVQDLVTFLESRTGQ